MQKPRFLRGFFIQHNGNAHSDKTLSGVIRIRINSSIKFIGNAVMEKIDTKPWYKYFWPWFLIAVPVSSFIMAYFLVNFAANTEDSLVVDDYYKEGKAINASMAKVEEARRLRIMTDLTVNDGQIALEFHSGIPSTGNALKLNFYHVTLQEKDFSLLLTRDAKGVYRGFTEQDTNGKWRVSLTPIDDSWKVQQEVSLPRKDKIRFVP